MKQISFSCLVVFSLLFFQVFNLYAQDTLPSDTTSKKQSSVLILRCGGVYPVGIGSPASVESLIGYATPMYRHRRLLRMTMGLSSYIIACFFGSRLRDVVSFFHFDAVTQALSDGTTSLMLGLSIVKPFEDKLNITIGHATRVYDTHTFMSTLHGYLGVGFAVTPSSIIEVSARIPFTRSIRQYGVPPIKSLSMDSHVYVSLSYQYMIVL